MMFYCNLHSEQENMGP